MVKVATDVLSELLNKTIPPGNWKLPKSKIEYEEILKRIGLIDDYTELDGYGYGYMLISNDGYGVCELYWLSTKWQGAGS